MKLQVPTLSSIFEDDDKFGWLDTVSDPVQETVNKLFHSSPVGMKIKSLLNGTPLMHRIHPALVVVPLGSWTTALIFDVLEGFADDNDKTAYRTAADAAISVGILGALPSAKTGVADWVDLYAHRRRVGTAHAMLNVAALACYVTSLAIRKGGGPRGPAVVLAGAGFGMIALSGALGGELVYTLGVNVPHNLHPTPPNRFTDVLASEDLVEDTPKVVNAGRVSVLLMRRGDTIYAVDNWCPHAGGPLSRGKFEGDVVECPWHQSRFCLADGKPLQGPAASPLRTFEVREEGGRISVRPSYEGQP